MTTTITSNPTQKTDQAIENLHETMRRQFAELYTAQRPTLREIRAQQKAEAIEKIKNILFAKVLVRMVKNHSIAGNNEPLIIDLGNLAEVI